MTTTSARLARLRGGLRRERALGDGRLDGLAPHVVGVHAVAGLEEVRHHGQPHVAQPDESDRLHVSAPCAAHRDARACTAAGRTRLARHPARGRRQSTTSAGAGQTPRRAGRRSRAACYNPAPRMLGRDWALLVTGTLLGVVSLTADLLGLGALPGFGWKQVDRDGGRPGSRHPARAGASSALPGETSRERGWLGSAPHDEPDPGPRQPPPRLAEGRPHRPRPRPRRDADARVHAPLLDPVPDAHPPPARPPRRSPRHQAGRQDRAAEGLVPAVRPPGRRRPAPRDPRRPRARAGRRARAPVPSSRRCSRGSRSARPSAGAPPVRGRACRGRGGRRRRSPRAGFRAGRRGSRSRAPRTPPPPWRRDRGRPRRASARGPAPAPLRAPP